MGNAALGNKKATKDRSKFASDQKLKDLLATADEITSLDHFLYWKDTFLKGFRQYLDHEQTIKAREADEKLYKDMQKLTKLCLKIKKLCKNCSENSDGNDIEKRDSKKNFKLQLAVNNFVSHLARTEKMVHEYFPKTKDDEAKVGYNKFNLAAILVRDGFQIYDLMVHSRRYITKLSEKGLRNILTPNNKSIIQYYLTEIDGFCDCLADLGMFKLMVKCLELFKIRKKKKKKKPFNRETMDPLSDTSDDENINKGRMLVGAKGDFRSIITNGWTSGLTGTEILDPEDKAKKIKPPEAGIITSNPALKKSEEEEHIEDDEPDPLKPEHWIYYYDPDTEQ